LLEVPIISRMHCNVSGDISRKIYGGKNFHASAKHQYKQQILSLASISESIFENSHSEFVLQKS